MRKRILLAASVLLAAAAASAVMRDNGWQCAQAHACLTLPDPVDQFECCMTFCAQTEEKLNQCFQAVIGVPPPNDRAAWRLNAATRIATAGAAEIRSGKASPERTGKIVYFMTAFAALGTDQEAQVMNMLAGSIRGTGDMVRRAYAGRVPHNEGGDIRTTK